LIPWVRPGSRSSSLRRRFVLAAIAAALLAVAATALTVRVARKEPRLPRLGGVPGFVLYDQTGAPFPSSKFDGQVLLVDFFFTRCRGLCPILTGRLRWFQDRLGKRPGWHLVSVTVDPAHDPPGALTEYARENGADPERWTFLCGEPEVVRNVVTFGFRVAVAADSTSTSEPFLHSKSIVLVDPGGEIRGYYDATDEKAMKQLLHDARRLLREKR
jgi:protein SCO1/2